MNGRVGDVCDINLWVDESVTINTHKEICDSKDDRIIIDTKVYKQELNLHSNGVLVQELVEGYVDLQQSLEIYHFRVIHSHVNESHTIRRQDA